MEHNRNEKKKMYVIPCNKAKEDIYPDGGFFFMNLR